MDVRCPQCNTLYELDDGQLRSATATLKCSQCQHVFRLHSPSRVSQENQRRWMVRRRDTGDVLYFTTFDTLHAWLMERKVGRTDAISRTGKKWVTLESIGEFAPIFQVVDSISSLTGGDPLPPRANEQSAILNRVSSDRDLPSQQPSQQPSPPADASGERRRVRTNLQFAGASQGEQGSPEEVTQRARPSQRTPAPTPAPRRASDTMPPGPPRVQLDSGMFGKASDRSGDGWELGEDLPLEPRLDRSHSETHQIPRVPPRRGPWIALGLLVALGAGAGYLWVFQRDTVQAWVAPPTTEPVSLTAPAASAAPAAAEAEPDAPTVVTAALQSALKKKEHREAQIFGGAVVGARESLAEAASVAGVQATKASETPSADDLVASARKAGERGDHDRARSLYHRALEERPSDVEAITGLGWTLIELGQPSAAAAQFRKALHHDGGHGDAYIGLGSAERQLGNLQGAHDAYERYLGVHPNGPKASIASYQMDQLKKQLGM